MKVVIDTNVFISAILSQNGYAIDILRAALKKEIVPYFGIKLFKEYEDVVSRDKIIKNSKLTIYEVDQLLNSIISISKWTEVYYLYRPNLKDEGDNHVLELCVASNVECLITSNKKDFITSELKFDFDILTPQEFFSKKDQK